MNRREEEKKDGMPGQPAEEHAFDRRALFAGGAGVGALAASGILAAMTGAKKALAGGEGVFEVEGEPFKSEDAEEKAPETEAAVEDDGSAPADPKEIAEPEQAEPEDEADGEGEAEELREAYCVDDGPTDDDVAAAAAEEPAVETGDAEFDAEQARLMEEALAENAASASVEG